MGVVQVEQLIISELEKLSQEGFSRASIEAAVNSIEFDLRENNTGRFPRGLSLMLRSMSAWIYDRDPLSRLRWTEPLEHFKVASKPCHAFSKCRTHSSLSKHCMVKSCAEACTTDNNQSISNFILQCQNDASLQLRRQLHSIPALPG